MAASFCKNAISPHRTQSPHTEQYITSDVQHIVQCTVYMSAAQYRICAQPDNDRNQCYAFRGREQAGREMPEMRNKTS